jgi:hypothetical protein
VTPFVLTYILWGILSTANPNVNLFVIFDEFSERAECLGIAKGVAPALMRDLKESGMEDFTSATVVCLPIAAGKETQQPNGKPKNHLLTEPLG